MYPGRRFWRRILAASSVEYLPRRCRSIRAYPDHARRLAFMVGAGLMVSVGLRPVDDPSAILLFSLAGFAHQTLSVTVITMSSDLFCGEVAMVAGLAGKAGNAGVLVFTLMVGGYVAIGYALFACLSTPDIVGR